MASSDGDHAIRPVVSVHSHVPRPPASSANRRRSSRSRSTRSTPFASQTSAAIASEVTAIVPRNTWSRTSATFDETTARVPKPWLVPPTETAASRTRSADVRRGPKRNADQRSGGTHRYVSG